MSRARADIMRAVRVESIQKFKAFAEKMIQANEFSPGECIVETIAKATATKVFNVPADQVKIIDLHNGWRSAQFTYSKYTPMPPPPPKSEKLPPVYTETKFMVIKASGKIRLKRQFIRTAAEEESNMGGEVLVEEYQRPTPLPATD